MNDRVPQAQPQASLAKPSVAFGLAFSIFLGLCDAAASALLEGPPPAFYLLSAILTTSLIFFLIYLVAGSALAVFAKLIGANPRALQAALYTFIASSFLLLSFGELLYRNPSREEVILISTQLGVSAALAVLVWFLVRRRCEEPLLVGSVWRKLAKLGYGLVLALIFSTFAVWKTNQGPDLSSMTKQLGEAPKHHVFLIVIDTLRTDALSCLGGALAATPNIDGLAQDGIVFSQAYSPAPWTIPAMASMFTGLPPGVHKMLRPNSLLDDRFETMTEALARGGYYTVAVGENAVLARSNMDQGFNRFDFYPKTDRGYSLGARVLEKSLPAIFRKQADAQVITDLALDFLPPPGKRKLMMWLHYFDPHLPYAPPARHLPDQPKPDSLADRFDGKNQVQTGHLILDRQEREWIRSLYQGEVAFVDEQVGRLIRRLKDLQIYDESLIILTSDHGEELWDHEGFGHGHTLYNELIRVPLIVKLPGQAILGVRENELSTQGLKKTVLDLCGLVAEDDSLFDRSWLEKTGDRQADVPQPIHSTGVLFFNRREAVIQAQTKLIRSLTTGRLELFDLTNDPKELLNRAGQSPEQVKLAEQLLAEQLIQSEIASKNYGLTQAPTTQIDKGTIELLQAIGYLQAP